jgi:hypothetical protein
MELSSSSRLVWTALGAGRGAGIPESSDIAGIGSGVAIFTIFFAKKKGVSG